MPVTRIMAIGNLRLGDAELYQGPGGPTQYATPESVEPPWLINRLPMPAQSTSWPQNPMRVTDKTSSGRMSSTGQSVYALYGLGMSLGAPDDAAPPAEKTKEQLAEELGAVKSFCAGRTLAGAILGGTVAGIQGHSRKVGAFGVVTLVVLGGLFPLLTNGALFFWPKR